VEGGKYPEDDERSRRLASPPPPEASRYDPPPPPEGMDGGWNENGESLSTIPSIAGLSNPDSPPGPKELIPCCEMRVGLRETFCEGTTWIPCPTTKDSGMAASPDVPLAAATLDVSPAIGAPAVLGRGYPYA
jgi:hypothetical protein